MWGQGLYISTVSVFQGIIPTRVGTSIMTCDYRVDDEDHPHACGDKVWSANTIFGIVGSSPRVWGQELVSLLTYSTSGIIPTRVGTRCQLPCPVSKLWDHPHACGDKFYSPQNTAGVMGSSPRVWGQECSNCYKIKNCRIIPTRVGTRSGARRLRATFGNHPHACGDKVGVG